MRKWVAPAVILGVVVTVALVDGIVILAQRANSGDSVRAEPSESPALSPTESVSPPDGSNEPTTEEFCDQIDELVAYNESLMEQFPSALNADFLTDETLWDDPELLAALHQWGRIVLDEADTMGAYYQRAAELVGDPDLAVAFETLARTTKQYNETWGRATSVATSIGEWVQMEEGFWEDPEMAAIEEEASSAGELVGQYIYDTCGVDVFGGTDTQDEAAADVRMIGLEIATYFVDWDGQTLPVITSSDGRYYLGDVPIGRQSSGVTLVEQFFISPTDWCVSVMGDGDFAASYSFSAQGGLQPGSCS